MESNTNYTHPLSNFHGTEDSTAINQSQERSIDGKGDSETKTDKVAKAAIDAIQSNQETPNQTSVKLNRRNAKGASRIPRNAKSEAGKKESSQIKPASSEQKFVEEAIFDVRTEAKKFFPSWDDFYPKLELTTSFIALERGNAREQEIEFLKTVKHLDLENFEGLNLTIEKIVQYFPNLEHLNLGNFVNLTDKGLELLSSLKSLNTLTIKNSRKITTEGLIEHLARLPQLEYLKLENCPQITHQVIKQDPMGDTYEKDANKNIAKNLKKQLPSLNMLVVEDNFVIVDIPKSLDYYEMK